MPSRLQQIVFGDRSNARARCNEPIRDEIRAIRSIEMFIIIPARIPHLASRQSTVEMSRCCDYLYKYRSVTRTARATRFDYILHAVSL
jgi:hypothetical protein